MPAIRSYRPGDRAAVADICVRTGSSGEDSRERYLDLDLLPSISALPYVELEPELAFVLGSGADGSGEAVGYILGTVDTRAFVERYRRDWLPAAAARHPPLTGPPRTPSEEMVDLLHQPERMLRPELADHPAHLHIDLLPGQQGAGHGRALMTTFLRALDAAGVQAVHLGMSSDNARAGAFYDRMGFEKIEVPEAPGTTYMGRAVPPRSPRDVRRS